MTELQRVAYSELYAALVQYGRHGWVRIEGRAGEHTCPKIHGGECLCGLDDAIELLNPETVGI